MTFFFASRPRLRVFTTLLANGKDIISSPYGEHWRQMKSICTIELLSSKRVRSYNKLREEEVELMLKNIPRSKVVNLSEMFRSLSKDLICKVAFGRKYRREEGGIDFTKLLDEYIELLGGFFIGDFISWLAWINKFNGVDAKLSRVSRTFDLFLERILQKHSDRGGEKDRDTEENEQVAKDFVDVLLEIQRDGHRHLDRERIKAIILDMFAAATEANHIALEWMMSELLKNPRVMEELQKEVTRITGDKKMVTEDDLQSMNYLKAVFKESLRLHTPGPILVPRECTNDITINGYDISAGMQVIVNAWSISRDPKYWEEPEIFHPERFLNSPIDFKGNDFQFIPFGSGRRMCPGMAFSTATVELVIANLVHHFNWSLPDGVDSESMDVTEAPGLVMIKKHPLLAVASARFS